MTNASAAPAAQEEMPMACELTQTARAAMALCSIASSFILAMPGPAFAQEAVSLPIPVAPAASEDAARAAELQRAPELVAPDIGVTRPPIVFDQKSLLAQQEAAPGRPAEDMKLKSSPVLWGQQKSYAIPALEILGFDTLLNLFDRAYYGCCDFKTTGSSIRRNLRSSWGVDSDTFTVNQLGHPYQGSMYFGFARASGLNFWEGFAYAFAGSALWEIAGETTPPSKNDQINTSVGGTFLGESLFRMANLLLEQGKGPRIWRELGAAAISPPVGFNRLAFGKRFDPVYSSNNAEYYSRVAVGVTSATQNRPGTTTEVTRNEGVVDFSLDYGMPGTPGYAYKRPFDYFAFQAAASSAIGFESVMTRGLLLGTAYEGGKNVRGIWGLYGSYDYISPQIFRMASSAVSLGTTAEWHISNSLTLQGSGLLGAGYATVSTIRGIANERANHYGFAPQGLLALRLIMGDRASLDLTAREYFVSDVGGDRGGHDNVVRADASLTYRISGPHAVAVRYQLSRRDAQFPDLGDRTQSRGTVGIFYTLLGRDRFANVNWR